MAETKIRFEALTGGRLLEAYAMTETMLAAVACPVHGVYKEGSTGVPISDVEVRIVDVDSGEEDLPPMGVGEIIDPGAPGDGRLLGESNRNGEYDPGWLGLHRRYRLPG